MVSFEANGRHYLAPQGRVLAICADGWGVEHAVDALVRGLMPSLAAAIDGPGAFWSGLADIPTVTNVNNASIITGVSPAKHGISGNHYRDPHGSSVPLTSASALRASTIHANAERVGIPTLSVSAKDKLTSLLGAGGTSSFSAENAAAATLPGGQRVLDLVEGPAPAIYDWDLSIFAIKLALAASEVSGARLVYVSLTDFVHHIDPPGGVISDQYARSLDEQIERAMDAGYSVGVTADHGMNAKSNSLGGANVRYLESQLAQHGIHAEVLLPITDPYLRHHAGLGSVAYLYLEEPDHIELAIGLLSKLEGVEVVLPRDEASRLYELPPDRVGDLVVLGNRVTVFGKTPTDHDTAYLDDHLLRSHGGCGERYVPVLTCQPPAVRIDYPRNRDLYQLLIGDPDPTRTTLVAPQLTSTDGSTSTSS